MSKFKEAFKRVEGFEEVSNERLEKFLFGSPEEVQKILDEGGIPGIKIKEANDILREVGVPVPKKGTAQERVRMAYEALVSETKTNEEMVSMNKNTKEVVAKVAKQTREEVSAVYEEKIAMLEKELNALKEQAAVSKEEVVMVEAEAVDEEKEKEEDRKVYIKLNNTFKELLNKAKKEKNDSKYKELMAKANECKKEMNRLRKKYINKGSLDSFMGSVAKGLNKTADVVDEFGHKGVDVVAEILHGGVDLVSGSIRTVADVVDPTKKVSTKHLPTLKFSK